jgi:hypothetical protein
MAELAPTPHGLLELSLTELADLADATVDATADAEPADELAAVGRAVREAIVEIEVTLQNRVGIGSALAIAGPDLALLAVGPPGAGMRDRQVPRRVVLRPAMGLIYSLAELLEVEARRPPPLTEPLVLPPGTVDGLVTSPVDDATALVEHLVDAGGLPVDQLEALRLLARQLRAAWSVRAAVPVSDDEVVERRHRVVDGGDAGWWMLAASDEADALVPSTGRRVLEVLESLLPADDELHALTDVVDPPGPA